MHLTKKEQATLRCVSLAGIIILGGLLWQYRVPLGEPRDTSLWIAQLEASRRVDINSAGINDLIRIPGIGASLAERIITFRDKHGSFNSTDALMQVRGIGPHTLAAISDFTEVR